MPTEHIGSTVSHHVLLAQEFVLTKSMDFHYCFVQVYFCAELRDDHFSNFCCHDLKLANIFDPQTLNILNSCGFHLPPEDFIKMFAGNLCCLQAFPSTENNLAPASAVGTTKSEKCENKIKMIYCFCLMGPPARPHQTPFCDL